jgi:hypothetical protein
MDLGALELQIFVSLVVVLGSAFVALICDYLKGNNEQLRERNIELRVRTEERERFAILNPSAWLSQFRSTPAAVANAVQTPAAPVAAESVMQSHATAEGLAQVAEREATLMGRADASGEAVAEVPSVAGFDVSERRRSRRKRGGGAETAAQSGENSYDWVRPEVMARVARRAGGGQRDVVEEAAEVPETVEVASALEQTPLLLEAPVEARKPVVSPDPEIAVPMALAPSERQTEMEHISQAQARPASTPPVIMLRPLPTMKLADELQRIAESTQVAPAPFTSQLLEDVIAASAAKPSALTAAPEEVLSVEPAEEIAAPQMIAEEVAAQPETAYAFASFDDARASTEPPPPFEEALPVVAEPAVTEPETTYAFAPLAESAQAMEVPPVAIEMPVERPETDFAFASLEDVEPAVEAPPVVVEQPLEEPETAYAFVSLEHGAPLLEVPPAADDYPALEPATAYAFEMPEYAGSAFADVLTSPAVASPEPPPVVEELPFPSVAAFASPEPSPAFAATFPTYDSLPPVVETPAYDWSGAEFAPLPETVFASEAFAAETYGELPTLEPVTVSAEVPALPPVAAEIAEDLPVTQPENLSELLLPAGMQDLATYWRLLEMPNPMSGIVITISITDFNRLSTTVGEKDLAPLLDSVEVLMSSMVRDGDFGVKVAADQWVFVYRIDENGFSQRRVAGLSEKLWDFQLRHLGLSNISFNWAAVNVHAERLSDAVTAAVERMEASRRGTKKSGAERARLVANG